MTQRDEFAYHEMLVHVPIFAHSNPKRVLIVGGGDGGVLRELCRHDCIEYICMVEIDEMVVQVCKEYFDFVSESADKKVEMVFDVDAAVFVKNYVGEAFDVIIADTSDPLVGPAESLFQPMFYESMYKILNPKDGIVCAQGECMWLHLPLIVDIMACCNAFFDSMEYATTMVPTYPCGQIGFLLGKRGGGGGGCRVPKRNISAHLQSQLKWYNPAIHQASFVLPQFVLDKLPSTIQQKQQHQQQQQQQQQNYNHHDVFRDDNYHHRDNDDDDNDNPRCFVSSSQCIIS